MKCPSCKLENPREALRCDCGYDFLTRTRQKSYLESGPSNLHTRDAKLTWYQHVWVALPFGLIALGGALGGLCGGAAWAVNLALFQRINSRFLRYAATGLISLVALVVYWAIAGTLLSLLGQQR
jgi:hypothetical protein